MKAEIDMSSALSALVMDDDTLGELEILLGKFNLFRVLKADQNELRHSNMLAWLLTPSEAHGLDETFLRRWLMEVTNAVGSEKSGTAVVPSPVWIDAADISEVKVYREWRNVDLLVNFQASVLGGRYSWVIAIENKVNASQGQDQLEKYRRKVERQFPEAGFRCFLFLTKNGEKPADTAWITVKYDSVMRALMRCVEGRRDRIGQEPLFLIEQYLELLRDDFMDKGEATDLARAIYRRHAAAIDFINECKIDPRFVATNLLEEGLRIEQRDLGIMMEKSNKGIVRFIPIEWDVPGNRGGEGWGEDSRIVLCEVSFHDVVWLEMVMGYPPEDWADELWERAQSQPFNPKKGKRAKAYPRVYSAQSNIEPGSFLEMDDDEVREHLLSWVKSELKKDRYRNAVEEVARRLRNREASK